MLRNYALAFQRAVGRHFQREENPEAGGRARLVGDFVASNKRDVMFVVLHGSTLYEIKYKMPVPEQIENLFANQSLEPTGPSFFVSRSTVADAPAAAAAAAARFAYQPWAGEIQRLETKFAGLPNTPENKAVRKTVRNILEFWRMRGMLLDALDNIDVVVPGLDSSGSGSSSSGSSSSPKSISRSSSRSRRSVRRHSSAKSHHTPSRHSTPRTSDPKPKPNSDPRRRKTRSRASQ